MLVAHPVLSCLGAGPCSTLTHLVLVLLGVPPLVIHLQQHILQQHILIWLLFEPLSLRHSLTQEQAAPDLRDSTYGHHQCLGRGSPSPLMMVGQTATQFGSATSQQQL